MEITFLGTASAMPTRRRNVASLALRLPDRREVWLFDCGEATQHRLLISPLRPPQIRRIFISHLHGDHVYGLPGLLTSLGLLGAEGAVDVHGPAGLAELVETSLRVSHSFCSFPIHVHPLASGPLLTDGDLAVRCAQLDHGVASFGFRIEEAPRPGRFDVARAAELGVPPGPLYGALKAGGSVTLADGRRVEGASLTAPDEPGRVVTICGDTRPCDAAVELARDADLLVHEATFGESRRAMAAERGHSTAAQAAEVARAAGARRLLITHFSARYQEGGEETVEDLLREARAVFPATDAAADLLAVAVPRRTAAQ
jgi:ribonuclease Z